MHMDAAVCDEVVLDGNTADLDAVAALAGAAKQGTGVKLMMPEFIRLVVGVVVVQLPGGFFDSV